MPRAGARAAFLALLTCLASWLSACDVPAEKDTGQKPSSEVKVADRCRLVIGKSGIARVEKSYGSKVVDSGHEVGGLDAAVRSYRYKARTWSPDNDEGLTLRFPPDVCRLTPENMERGDRLVRIRFGPSFVPFNELDAEGMDGSRLVEAGPDVRFVAWTDEGQQTQYSIYVKCRVEGALDRQETRLPIEVLLTDNLSREAGDVLRFDLLLDAAQVVVRKVGCLNNPKLPEGVPIV